MAAPPIGCVAALAVLDAIRDEQLIERANPHRATHPRGDRAADADELGRTLANLRGLGAMIGFDVMKARGGREPDGAMVKKILATALRKGLLCISCGVHGETIRLLVPLTISDEDLKRGLAILTDLDREAGVTVRTFKEDIMKSTRHYLVALAVAGLLATSHAERRGGGGGQKADLILHNGKVLTVDKDFSIKSAIAVKGGKILAVGGEEIARNYTAPKTVDLKGAR